MADPVPSYEAFFKLDTGTHTGDIRQIVVSPDGQTLITAGECTIRVWDLKTRQLLRMLLGQVADRSQEVFGDGNVRRMALSPNGLWLVALKAWSQQTSRASDAGQVTEVQVFELATGNLQAAFRHPGLLFDLDFSPDGRLLALVGNDCERRIRRAVVSVYAARDVLRGGFEPTRKPLASQAFSTGPRQDELPAAVRFIPGRRKGHGGHRLVVASQGKGLGTGPRTHPRTGQRKGAGQPAGVLAWYTFGGGKSLRQDRCVETDVAIAPGTLAVSHELVVAGAARMPRHAQRFGHFLCHDHQGQLVGTVLTESSPASILFSSSGKQLLVGMAAENPGQRAAAAGGPPIPFSTYDPGRKGPDLPGADVASLAAAMISPNDEVEPGMPPVAGDQTVQVNAYATGFGDFELRSSYYGHDGSITALACLDDGTVISAGGDNQAIHFWSASHRVGELKAAIRGVGSTCYAPGINALENVLFGTLPMRLLPPNHAPRQQSFDLRAMALKTTCPSEVDESDFESDKWSILAWEPAQTIPLRFNEPAMDPDLPPDLTLFVGTDDEWVIWSRSGYYDTSPNGAQRVGYHVNRGADKEALFFPADRFKPFYRPDIIRAVVEHGTEDRARAAGIEIPRVDVAQILPPIVELANEGVVAGPAHVSLHFTVTALRQANPVKRVWILRNDRFVWSEPAPAPKARARYKLQLPLLPGRNVFSIRAENQDAKSMPVVFEVAGPEPTVRAGSQDAASGNLYLLSVGVSDFAVANTADAAGFKPLKYAHQDAIAIYNAFAKSRRSGQHDRRTKLKNRAFDAVEATLLLNGQATKAAILGALDGLCTRIRERSQTEGAERDVLFVFLSGHGTRFKGEPDLYFWNYDLRPTSSDLATTGLSMTDLGDLITSVPAEVVLVIDACHAGMAGGNLMSGLDAEELARRIQAVNERGMYVLNGARSEEKARESDAAGQGVFTSALLGTLKSERYLVPEQPGSKRRAISMLGLIAGTQELVPFFSARAQVPAQTPVCRMYGDLLPLTIYKT